MYADAKTSQNCPRLAGTILKYCLVLKKLGRVTYKQVDLRMIPAGCGHDCFTEKKYQPNQSFSLCHSSTCSLVLKYQHLMSVSSIFFQKRKPSNLESPSLFKAPKKSQLPKQFVYPAICIQEAIATQLYGLRTLVGWVGILTFLGPRSC